MIKLKYLLNLIFINFITLNLTANDMKAPKVNLDKFVLKSKIQLEVPINNLDDFAAKMLEMQIPLTNNLSINFSSIVLFAYLSTRIEILKIIEQDKLNLSSFDVLIILILITNNIIFNNFFIKNLSKDEKTKIETSVKNILQNINNDNNIIEIEISNILEIIIPFCITTFSVTKNQKSFNIKNILENKKLKNILGQMIKSQLSLNQNIMIATILGLPEDKFIEILKKLNNKTGKESSGNAATNDSEDFN